jgi:hypothetical protein
VANDGVIILRDDGDRAVVSIKTRENVVHVVPLAYEIIPA